MSRGDSVSMRRILFVCIENSCRSQIAEAWAKNLGKDIVEAYSAGSKPSGVVNPMSVVVMGEVGIDISKNGSKGFDDLPVKSFDYAVTLGCGDKCPFVSAKDHVEWGIEDPKGKGLEGFRKTRDEIKEKVKELIAKIIKEGKQI